MTIAVCSLGANLGDRMANLQAAVDGLGASKVSSVYQTEPWGDPEQPAYLNAVAIAAHPRRQPHDWLALAQRVERRAGRVRDPARRYGPRPLDVDIVTIWSDAGVAVESADPQLTLPHPRAHVRAFVLVPWFEVEPDAVAPGAGPVRDLLATPEVAADLPGVRRRGDLMLLPARRGDDCTRGSGPAS